MIMGKMDNQVELVEIQEAVLVVEAAIDHTQFILIMETIQLMANQEVVDNLVQLAQRVILVAAVLVQLAVVLVILDNQEMQVQMGILETQAQQVMLELEQLLVAVDNQELLVPMEQQATKVPLEQVQIQVQQDNLERQEQTA